MAKKMEDVFLIIKTLKKTRANLISATLERKRAEGASGTRFDRVAGAGSGRGCEQSELNVPSS